MSGASVLLTGFEPFTTGQGLELTHNPTADIALRVTSDDYGEAVDLLEGLEPGD